MGSILTAVLLAVGTELTTGDTLDTNTRELARTLTGAGVSIRRIEALPDDLSTVVDGFRRGLDWADLIVSTGGLGPTPDDLTREAIAEVLGETPAVDPELEAWLRNLFSRRRMPFPETNLKQAWLVPSARPIPNPKGTAPGWWVERESGASGNGRGTIVVALPGPPSEMRAMWSDEVLPRLRARGLGRDVATRTLRLSGIGESHVAARLGDQLLRGANPEVATYARGDAVDVKISAYGADGRGAAEMVDEVARGIEAALGKHIWGRDDDTWPRVLGRELESRGVTLSLVEVATGGATTALLGDAAFLAAASVVAADTETPIRTLAEQARESSRAAGSDRVGLAVRADQTGPDTAVELAAAGPWGVVEDRRVAFLGGAEGRRRAALTAATFLHELLRAQPAAPADSTHNQGERRVRGTEGS